MERLRLYPEPKGNCKGELRQKAGFVAFLEMADFSLLPVSENPSFMILPYHGFTGGHYDPVYCSANAENVTCFLNLSTTYEIYSLYFVSDTAGKIGYYKQGSGSVSSLALTRYNETAKVYVNVGGVAWNYYENWIAKIPVYESYTEGLLAAAEFLGITTSYPINYYRTGCTITGPLDAAPGQDCVITVNPNQGYTFKGSSGVRIVDSSGANVPFIVSGNQVSFTYPQPI